MRGSGVLKSWFALRRLECDPRAVLLDLQVRAALTAGDYHPLKGWLQHGAWASGAKAVTLMEQRHCLTVRPDGVSLRLAQSALTFRLRELVIGLSGTTFGVLQQH
eukprot:6117941-Amphidinium_carterae.1